MSALPCFYALLPPLWQLVASYLDHAERWFYADDFPCLPRRLNLFNDKRSLDAVLWNVIVGNHTHMLGVISGPYFSSASIFEVVRFDRVEIMAWLLKTHPGLLDEHYGRSEASTFAAQSGAVDVLAWENETRINPWTSLTCSTLAQYGRFDSLRRLRECSIPWDHSTYVNAVYSGNVEMVKWFEKVDPVLAINSDDIIGNIETKPMMDHFLDRESGLWYIERLVRECQTDVFRFVLERRVIDAFISADRVVIWVLQTFFSQEKAMVAIDYGYPLPGPDLVAGPEPISESVLLDLRDLGWQG